MSKSAKLVSILTSTIGRPELRRCIESVRRQTYPHIQHLIAVDGPANHEKAREILKDYPGIDVIYLPYATKQWGAHIIAALPHLSRGDFLQILDDDNFLEPEHIESMVQTIAEAPWAYSLRNFVVDGAFIGRDNCESLGYLHPQWNTLSLEHPVYHIDVGCFFLSRPVALELAWKWATVDFDDPGEYGNDRVFFAELHARYPGARCNLRHTFNYEVRNEQLSFFTRGNERMRERYGSQMPWMRHGYKVAKTIRGPVNQSKVSGPSPSSNKTPGMLSMFWQSELDRANLGDLLNLPVFEHLGYDLIDARVAPPGRIVPFEKCVLGIGSLLDDDWRLRAGPKKIVVWGSGTHLDHRLTTEVLSNQFDFRCVRGPLTKKLLGLRDNLPTGDPALLLRRFFPVDVTTRSGILSIPHIHNRLRTSLEERFEAEGADAFLDIAVRQDDWKLAVQRIARAEFVLTNSLHGAILAQAYDTPWALCLSEGEALDKPFKWEDWAAYLGITLKLVKNYKEGIAWWETAGQHGRIQSLDQIEESFPHDCAV